MSVYIQNKKARFNFEFLEEFEAGVVLSGHEVKSIRVGKGNLTGSYVLIRGGEAFLVGATISPYQTANTPNEYDPERTRKLLLHQKELSKLERESEQVGLTIVPVQWYNKSGKVKLKIALARGKKKHDKRETIKARDSKRDLQRILKNQ